MKKETRMLIKKLKPLLVLISLFGCLALNAQNVTVSGALAGNGSYTDLASAFNAINGGAQTSANISVLIVANTTETTTAVLNTGAWSTLSITPSGGSYNVGGSIAGPLISFNGASNVYMDGLNSGGNALAITNSNTASGAVTIRFINSASGNTVTNISAFGACGVAGFGVIMFSTASAATGNNNNVISNSNIGPVGASYPVNSIYSAGTAAFANTNNTISNCNIYDFFSATLATSGINILSNSVAWTISGNRFYQTATRLYTTGNIHKAIVIAGGGNAFTVNNNLIGYSSSTATGTYVMGGTIATRFIGIELSVGTLTASSVQGNTITAVTLSTSSGAATTNGIICGINITGGSANVGTSVGNLVGGTSGNNLINAYPTTTQGMIVGINSSSTGTITISNNYMGGCFSSGTTSAIAGGIAGVINSGVSTMLTISSNTIGNPTANNLQAGTLGLTTGNSLLYGVWLASSPTGTINVHNNLIRNGASYGVGTAGVSRGIYTGGTSGSGTYSITGNSILNLTTDNGNTAQGNGQLGNGGIIITNGVSNIISGNIIGNLSNTNTLTTSVNQAGISTAVSSNPTISNNVIYGLSNTGISTSTTAPSQVHGIFIRGGSGTLTINNNMISLGTGQTDNTAFNGVVLYGGGGTVALRLYYNTINIGGSVTSGNQSSFCFYRGGYNAFATTWSVDLKNNILTNTRTGGTGVHCAIANNYASTANTTGWGANASNYNILNTANSAAVAWYNGPVSFTNWQTTMNCDAVSFTGANVVYVNPANNLHLNMGTTPTQAESNGVVLAGFTNDIDSDTRPGPAASVNGAGFAPDIGADEFDGVFLDIIPPSINYTPPVVCVAGDVTFTANISDFNGVPTSGALAPKVYFRKNTNPYVSASGSLTSGTATNGVWTFTISAAAMGGLTSGDIVTYYLAAQDLAPVPNIGSNPAGLVASAVNSVTTHPVVAASFLAGGMAGTYTVGVGGNFPTLSSAASVYNTACLTGPVTYVLTDANYSNATGEAFPITFQNNPTASSTNSLLIIPASGNMAAITATVATSGAPAVVKFKDAVYITLDGIGTSGSGISITNNNTGVSTDVWLAGTSTVATSCNFIAIKNSTLTGGSIGSSYGIISCLDGPGLSVSGADNDNINIQGNTILQHFYGVVAVGVGTVSAGALDNWQVSGNKIGSTALATGTIGGSGILLTGALNSAVNANDIQNIFTTSTSGMSGINMFSNNIGYSISQNTITNVNSSAGTSGVNSIAGIYLGPGVINGTVAANRVSGVTNSSTGGWGSRGIIVNTGNASSNVKIFNNMVANIRSYSDGGSLYWPMGLFIDGTTGGLDIDFNTLSLSGSYTGLTSATGAAAMFINNAAGNLNIRNNIFHNSYDNTSSTTDISYGLYSLVANTNFGTINYNNYYVTGSAFSLVMAYLGGDQTSISGIQTAFGQNLNSVNLAPTFISNTDLHLAAAVTNTAINNIGNPVSGITLDIDGTTRNLTTPDMGADEFDLAFCSGAPPTNTVLTSNASPCASVNINLSLSTTYTLLGLGYQWQASTTGSNSGFNAIANATNVALTTSNSAGSTWYQMVVTCTSAAASSTTAPLALTYAAFPTASVLTSATTCPGNAVTLSGATDIGTSFKWTGPNSFSSTSQNALLTSNAASSVAGTYTLVTGVGNCSNTVTFPISVLSSPIYSTTPAASPTLICAGGTSQLTVSAYAPINIYSYAASTGSTLVNTVTGNTVITTNNDDTPMATPAAIGFNFIFNGVQYSQFTASPDGWVMLGNGVGSAQFTNDIISTTNIPKIYPYWDDLATGTDGFVRTLLTGTAPNRIFIVEWFVTIPRNVSGAANSSFQMLLYETTNAIEFLYGTMGTDISGASSSGMTFSGSLYNSITFSNNSNSSTSANNSNLVQPASGTSYMYTPPALTYAWSGSNLSASSGTNVAASPTSPEVYTVVANASFGCPAPTRTMAINAVAPPTVNIASTSTLLCGGASATLTASGANSYSWSTGSTASSIVVAPSTSTFYTLDGTSAPCPFVTTSINISASTFPVVSISGNASVCAGQQTTALIAAGADTYSWNTGSSNTTIVTSTLSTNTTYTVTGYDLVGCSTNATKEVTVLAVPVLNISGTSSICAGQTVNLSATGAPSYSWDTGPTTSTISTTPTSSQVYTLTGTDAQGCYAVSTVSVTVYQNPVLNISGSTGLCTGQTANLTASGANTYLWSSGTGSTTASITDNPVSNTTYTVTGTDLQGCQTTTSQLVTVAASLSITIVGPSSICVGETANLTGNGGVTYTWSTGSTAATIAPNPTTTTTYSIIGASGTCSNTGVTTISVNPNPTVSVSGNLTICAGQTTTLTGNGASTYSWSSGDNTAQAALSPTVNTTYSLTGTNAFGCSNTTTAAVVSNSLPVINVAQSAGTVCVNSAATFTASGAATYSWSTSSNNTTISITPTAAAVYSVNGASSDGCVSSQTFALATNSLPVLAIVPASATVCSLSQATFNASGANTYTWNGSISGQTVAFTPTTSSTYTLSGTNALGCTSSTTLGVTTNSLPVLNVTPAALTVCALSQASFVATGANTYTWNNTVTSASIATNPSVSATYTIKGNSSDGCSSTQTVALTVNALPVLTISPATATVCPSTPAVFNGSGAITYTWSTSSNNTSISITPTSTATYSLSGTNANSCTATRTFVLATYIQPTINISPASATLCSGVTGTFVASGASSYTWQGTSVGATYTDAPTANVVYTLTGTSSNGCLATASVAVSTNSLPILSISPASPTVCNLSGVNFTIQGASTYTWNGNVQGSTVTLFQSGNTTHTVTGTDALGCKSTATVAVTTNSLPIVAITPSLITACALDVTTLTASGAATYSWVTGSTAISTTVNPSSVTAYSVVGTDALGCSAVANAVVITNTLPVLSVAPSNATICSLSPLTLTASGANTYTWSTNSNSNTAVVSPSVNSTFTVTGTETATGCKGSMTVAVVTRTLPIINVASSHTAVCDGGSATMTVSGANTYTWSGSTNDPTLAVTPTATSVYTASGTDGFGCTSSKTITIGFNQLPTVVVTPSAQTICIDEVATYSVSGAVNYTWMPGNVTANVYTITAPVSVSFYSVTGTDANNCSNVGSFALTVSGCVGLNEQANPASLITVFPNPSAGLITAKFEFEGRKQILISDGIGRVIEMRMSENQSEEFDLSMFAKGVYYVKVNSKTASANFKISVQ